MTAKPKIVNIIHNFATEQIDLLSRIEGIVDGIMEMLDVTEKIEFKQLFPDKIYGICDAKGTFNNDFYYSLEAAQKVASLKNLNASQLTSVIYAERVRDMVSRFKTWTDGLCHLKSCDKKSALRIIFTELNDVLKGGWIMIKTYHKDGLNPGYNTTEEGPFFTIEEARLRIIERNPVVAEIKLSSIDNWIDYQRVVFEYVRHLVSYF